MKHVRRWGAVHILLILFLGSWLGQFFASSPVDAEDMERLENKVDRMTSARP